MPKAANFARHRKDVQKSGWILFIYVGRGAYTREKMQIGYIKCSGKGGRKGKRGVKS